MTTLQAILLTALIAIWVFISIGFAASVIQDFINGRKREKREEDQAQRDKERDARDLEYHEKRMKALDK